MEGDCQPSPHLENWDFMLDATEQPPQELIKTYLGHFNISTMANGNLNVSSLEEQSTNFESPQAFPQLQGPISTTASPRNKVRKSHNEIGPQTDRWNCPGHSGMSLSPFAATHVAMATMDRGFISESLIRIYHDVLENNLACWLAEDTCPYQMDSLGQKITPLRQFIPAPQIEPEWGVAWSNRMYRRVKQLDRIAQTTKLIQLTEFESRAALKTLNLVVMAFATQWAQGNRRKGKSYSAARNLNDAESEFSEFGDDFEQNLQNSVWQQAKKALEDVSHLECFRVIYAELVFGLIQKPWIVNGYVLSPTNNSQDMKSTILSQVTAILAQDGPPVYLERGTRKIHALKHRFEAFEKGFMGIDCPVVNVGKRKHLNSFSVEDRRTVGLLYWMAVMFDTVSSSINERPVVVGDDECEHDNARGVLKNKTMSLILSRKWELDSYSQENSENPSPLHWPCLYEDATRAVARSAAVKVLLFRYISYLQNALRKGENGEGLEEIIQATTGVYRYWNKTHGSFFRELTKNFDAVPVRIRSWFPCIGIPWHLGSLMLADLLDFVDDNHLGLEKAEAERLRDNMAMRIRRFSATDLADMAMALAPQRMSASNQEQLKGFHFAVNGSPLLTEPWTILLVRAFTKAAVFHLGEADETGRHERSVLGHESDEFQCSIRRAHNCVNTLWLLGIKSRMAKTIAEILSRPLDLYKTGLYKIL